MNFQDYLNKSLQDPEFKTEYDRLTPKYEVIHQLIQYRIEQNLTQRELAERTGIAQSAIARLESGKHNPSIAFLQRIAEGMGKTLHIRFSE